MIDQVQINKVITQGLREATGCEVVKSNLSNAKIPPYPYISFTITNTDTRKGTYSADNSRRYMLLTQTWSFTVQSDDDNEAQLKAMRAKDWLDETGRVCLYDSGITVRSIGPITNRDTLLTLAYEYRKGFDAVFSLVNEIEGEEAETIERAEIKRSE